MPESAETPGGTFELIEGVIADHTRKRVYLMSPEGAVEAVDVISGQVVWTSRDIAKPLLVHDDVLVGQADSTDALRLGVVALETGVLVTTGAQALPGGIVGEIEQSLAGRLTTMGDLDGDDAVVSWRFEAIPLRGAFDPTAPQREVAQPPAAQQQTTGAIRLDLETGEVSTAPVSERTAEVDSNPFTQVSVDGRHRLTGELVGDDRTLDKYRWTIEAVDSDREVGQLQAESAKASFIVIGPVVLFEAVASMQRVGNEFVAAPRRLRAVDLETGGERWSRPLREVAWRGAMPP